MEFYRSLACSIVGKAFRKQYTVLNPRTLLDMLFSFDHRNLENLRRAQHASCIVHSVVQRLLVMRQIEYKAKTRVHQLRSGEALMLLIQIDSG